MVALEREHALCPRRSSGLGRRQPMAGYDYHVVIIGSGFGGSVAALRAAEKGYRVGVMESGRRWNDEDIPKSQWDLPHFLWFPAAHVPVPRVPLRHRHRSRAPRPGDPGTRGPRGPRGRRPDAATGLIEMKCTVRLT
jgi:choline dehydrogenase-like flavoprotein